jgi:hypothetical protein
MKKIFLITGMFAVLIACKKDAEVTPAEPQRCMHCVQVLTDYDTGVELRISDGGESSTYCDGVLDIVLAQEPGIINDTIIFNNGADTSMKQRYTWRCN